MQRMWLPSVSKRSIDCGRILLDTVSRFLVVFQRPRIPVYLFKDYPMLQSSISRHPLMKGVRLHGGITALVPGRWPPYFCAARRGTLHTAGTGIERPVW